MLPIPNNFSISCYLRYYHAWYEFYEIINFLFLQEQFCSREQFVWSNFRHFWDSGNTLKCFFTLFLKQQIVWLLRIPHMTWNFWGLSLHNSIKEFRWIICQKWCYFCDITKYACIRVNLMKGTQWEENEPGIGLIIPLSRFLQLASKAFMAFSATSCVSAEVQNTLD